MGIWKSAPSALNFERLKRGLIAEKAKPRNERTVGLAWSLGQKMKKL